MDFEIFLTNELSEIKSSVRDTNSKLSGLLEKDCPNRHKEIENRLTKTETRIYLLCAGIVIVVNLIGKFFLDKF